MCGVRLAEENSFAATRSGREQLEENQTANLNVRIPQIATSIASGIREEVTGVEPVRLVLIERCRIMISQLRQKQVDSLVLFL